MGSWQGCLEDLVMFGGFYKGKRVFLTGHTGFKGAWLALWLKQLGADVAGYSVSVPTEPSLVETLPGNTFSAQLAGDIRDAAKLKAGLLESRPDLIFHLAAQPLVRRSYKEPLETFEVNAMGTAVLLDSVRQLELSSDVIVITSDKCYENREWEYAYRETEHLGGHDVYSASKGATEIVAQSWNRSFFQPSQKLGKIVTARAGNVIGGGDYAEDRIVPDCVRALIGKQPITLRNPRAVRPWQHVFECLSGYLWLAARISTEKKNSPLVSSFNFGPEQSSRRTVQALVEQILKRWPGQWIDGSDPGAVHEAKLLALSIEKAASLLNWHPCWDFDTAVRETINWYYTRHVENGDILALSLRQLELYADDAARKGIDWVK